MPPRSWSTGWPRRSAGTGRWAARWTALAYDELIEQLYRLKLARRAAAAEDEVAGRRGRGARRLGRRSTSDAGHVRRLRARTEELVG